jgi:hypothetical protein
MFPNGLPFHYQHNRNSRNGFCSSTNVLHDFGLEVENQLNIHHNPDKQLNTTFDGSDYSSNDGTDSDSSSMNSTKIQKFQKLVYDAEIGEAILTRRMLWTLLVNRKMEKDACSNESNDDLEDLSDDESLDEFDSTLDIQLEDLHLQLLQTVLKAAKNKCFALTTSYFIDIIDNLKFREIK